MSHRPERKEKNCLNCGTMVQGRFCHVCGQENAEPKETFWGMVTHFVNDITHFDGKFFTTVKDLLFRPGFLSVEYMRGRRVSYLNPIRMYVFTSALFFLIFFSLRGTKDAFKLTEGNIPMTLGERDSLVKELQDRLAGDSSSFNLSRQIALLKDTSRPVTALDLIPYSDDYSVVGTLGGKYKSVQEYDSVQSARPPDQRDGWIKKLWNRRAIRLNEKYKHDTALSMEKISDSLLHKLPYLLFVSLPFFALILKLLYLRHRKEFYYADHGIFTVHHYILSFLLLMFIFLWSKMEDITGWGVWNFLIAITIIAWPVYLFLAMKRFYRQKFFKTFVKFGLLNFMGLLVMIFLLVFFFLFSIFQL
jgi:hypothetical protein